VNTPDKCPHCGDPAIDGTEFWTEYDCGTTVCCKGEQLRSEYCKVNAELAATKRELEEMRARVKKFEPYYLDYVSSVSAAGLPADGPCLACNGFGGHEEGCHGTTGLMTMAYELETLRARVRELGGLKLGNYITGQFGIWLEVLLPAGIKYDSRLCRTLGEAMGGSK
jgi:hypothetical protein